MGCVPVQPAALSRSWCRTWCPRMRRCAAFYTMECRSLSEVLDKLRSGEL